MNNQHDYLMVKAHIDDLVRDAERSRMARGASSRTFKGAVRGMTGRLRRLLGGCPDLTPPELHADCP